jgi:hypothetical protein
MKNLARDIFRFLVIFMILFHIYPEYNYWTNKYEEEVNGGEVYQAINASKKKGKRKKLILGDSVAKQFSESDIDTGIYLNLASNQAISLVGQYCLLSNYIHTKNKIDTLYLIYHPLSFSNNLDNSFTFHYFEKPFYGEEYMKLFTEEVKTQIEKIPFHYLAKYHPVLTSNWSPNYSSEEQNKPFISNISRIYLEKIEILCRVNNIHLIILSPPINQKFKNEFSEIVKSNANLRLKSYFEQLNYYPESYFLPDHVHLNKIGLTRFSFQELLTNSTPK